MDAAVPHLDMQFVYRPLVHIYKQFISLIYDNNVIYIYIYTCYLQYKYTNTSSTAQGGGGSFKNRKPIGEVGCCESEMAERIH